MREGRGGEAHLAARTMAHGGLVAAEMSPESKEIDGSRRWGRGRTAAVVLPGSSGGRQSKESTPAGLTVRVSGRGAAGGRDNDGRRRRLRLVVDGERGGQGGNWWEEGEAERGKW